MSEPRETLSIGAHSVTLEPPDVFLVRLRGDVSAEDVMGLLDVFERFATGPSRAYQLIDVADVGHVSPEARRAAAIRQLPHTYGGLVVFGGTFQQQLVVKLATTAGWFLRGRALGKPMPATLKDELSARKWVAERRKAT